MLHYKTLDGQVFAYDTQEERDAFGAPDLAAITDEEAAALTAPSPVPELIAPQPTAALRRAAYEAEADPLFFKSQRGEATTEQWLAKVQEIKARFPE